MNFVATIWIIGVVFLAAAVVGQAIKVRDTELPALTSRFSRIALAVVGVVALVLGGVVYFGQSLTESNTEPRETNTEPTSVGTTTETPESTAISRTEPAPAAPLPAPDRPTTVTNGPQLADVSPTTNPTAGTDESANSRTNFYNIRNGNGLCMDLPSNDLGTQVIIFACDAGPGKYSQKWTML